LTSPTASATPTASEPAIDRPQALPIRIFRTLASPLASGITGQVIDVDAGYCITGM
jgi:hypothetical protein